MNIAGLLGALLTGLIMGVGIALTMRWLGKRGG